MDGMAEARSSAVRRFGWVLIAVCLVAISLWVIAQAVADGGTFDQWVGWANIFALPVGAIGTALVIFDRVLGKFGRIGLTCTDTGLFRLLTTSATVRTVLTGCGVRVVNVDPDVLGRPTGATALVSRHRP
jgi:hypothetical protein